MSFKPGPGFFAMVEQTKRLDMERRIRREFKDHGYMELRPDEDVGEQMDAAMKVATEDDFDLTKERDLVIDTLRQMSGKCLGIIWWVKYVDEDGNIHFELLDGQQRILSICMYVGEYDEPPS